jgi:hypothetical protein
MFGLQVLLFWFLPNIATASLMTIVTFVVLMCYGGGFGTMPAFTADYFGPKNVGPDLRLDADRVGLCQRVRSSTHRAHARNRWFISRRASCHRRCHGGFNSFADPGASTTNTRHAH